MTAMPAFMDKSAPTQWAIETLAAAEKRSPEICVILKDAMAVKTPL